MYLSASDYWQRLVKLYPNGGTHYTNFILARHRYPDLSIFMRGPGGPIFCSEAVNQYCTDVEFIMEGKLVLAFPYLTEHGMRIYADPCFFVIAWQNSAGFGLIPDKNILEDLASFNISDEAIDIVEDHLKSKPPINY